MAEIFVSYRRDDTGILCDRVTSRLSARFGERRVFRDTNAIYVGSSWEQTLHTALQDCYVVIALIGADWLDARDAQGRQRLFDSQDFVRMELAAALAQSKRIIPVLANGARMPLASELPPDLAPLAQLPPLILRPDPFFDSDMQVIIQTAAPGVRKRVPYPIIALCGAAGLFGPLALTFVDLAQSSLGNQFSDAQFVLYAAGQLALLFGCFFIILRSLETRAWLWLALGALVIVPLLTGSVWLVALSFVVTSDTLAFIMSMIALLSQVFAITLTLVFGFFGPRRLSSLKTTQRWLRPLRWAVGGCATVVGIFLASMIVKNELNISISGDLLFATTYMAVVVALMGLGLAIASSLRQRRWWWTASLMASAALVVGGFWLYSDSTIPDSIAFSAFYIGVSGAICALDLFVLRSDLEETHKGWRSRYSTAAFT